MKRFCSLFLFSLITQKGPFLHSLVMSLGRFFESVDTNEDVN